MRIQTSLEFLVLTAVVALLSLSVISYYLPIYRSESRIAGASYAVLDPGNSLNMEVAKFRIAPKTELFLDNVSYLGKLGYLQMLVEGCNGSAELYAFSNSLVFLSNSSKLSIDGFGILSLPYMPASAGLANVQATYRLNCGNISYSNSSVLSTYVSSSSNSSVQIYAKFDSVKEGVNYQLADPVPIIYITQSTRCTLTNYFSYKPLPLPFQCGTSNVWGYELFSIYCYYNVGGTDTTTTCLYPHDTYYATSNITGASPTYSFILRIYTPFGLLILL